MASGNIRNRNAQLGEVLRCQAVQTFIHSRAQFEDDTLMGDIQPAKVMVEDVTTALNQPRQTMAINPRCSTQCLFTNRNSPFSSPDF